MTSALLNCPSCSSNKIDIFYHVNQVPVHSVLLLRSREAAMNYPKGDIQLGFCNSCGFIFNSVFNPVLHEYSADCEETQGFSTTFNAFHRKLVQDLINRYNLQGKDILEIGCGKGEFLTLLCQMGNNRGIGFDPAFVPERISENQTHQIKFINDFYSEKYANYKADFICCKMTLEHIQDTAEFVNIIRRSLQAQNEAIVFFQVPDVIRILEDIAFWDIYYEHCSYFSRGSLARLFRKCGFEILNVWNDYGDQYIMLEAKIKNGLAESLFAIENDLESIKNKIADFSQRFNQFTEEWKERLVKSRQQKRRVVLWGGGSKAVAFLTTLGITNEIEYAVDINPFKHGTFLAGTGQEVVAPAFLLDYQPHTIIVMNSIYKAEIQKKLAELGVVADLIAI